ncbi:sulfatase [Polaribacter vadi]|uniref:sulfatase n=1 Tax=Polaribacter TaxID=52959 RepID=UPI001C082691|nr:MULTISPECIES: sulfatase [Polaribacter]MBU3011329.1 sulfatase [Polaribacter vadi]MDO6741141.1 sulfatase [Polaribacter sp. 1_MG-2023]
MSVNAQSFVDSKKKPNIIYINVDDLGWMDTETYGSTFFETPNINKLAESGLKFTNGYASAANCAPSRACLISGQNTPRHGIYTVSNSDRGNTKTRKIIPIKNTVVLADKNVTLAEMLKRAGYTTGTFGKWHLGEDAKTQGFDVNVGGSHNGNPGKNGYFSPYNIKNIIDHKKGENLTDRLTQEAISFIKDNKEKPFFVYLPFYAVHTPLSTTSALEKKYSEKEGNSSKKKAIYAGMIETVDRNIGLILDEIKALNLKNTLIVFTSDNGGIRAISNQDPLRAGKGSYYEGGIRVPYIISWDGVVKPNTVSKTSITNLDFYPTFMDVLNVKMPKKVLDGISILPILKGGKIKKRSLFYHFPIYLQAYNAKTDQARDPFFRTRPGSVIIDGDWKLHQYFENNEIELYNLKEDLGEKNNIVEVYPKKASELLEKLNAWRTELNAPIPTELNPKYDADFVPNKFNKNH